jgi:hypothetical protein
VAVAEGEEEAAEEEAQLAEAMLQAAHWHQAWIRTSRRSLPCQGPQRLRLQVLHLRLQQVRVEDEAERMPVLHFHRLVLRANAAISWWRGILSRRKRRGVDLYNPVSLLPAAHSPRLATLSSPISTIVFSRLKQTQATRYWRSTQVSGVQALQ